MPLPTYQAAGAFAETATIGGTISPAWPAHQAGDVALLIVQGGGKPITIPDYAGFRELESSHQHQHLNDRSDNQTLAVFWKRASGAAEPAPVIKNTAFNRFLRSIIVTFRGCAPSGFPYDFTKGMKVSTSVNSLTAPGGTTTQDDALIVVIAGTGPPFSDVWTVGDSADLANEIERMDSGSSIGDDSNTMIATAEKAVAGTFAGIPLTYTSANNSRKGIITISLVSQVFADPKTPYLHALGEEVISTTGNITPAWPQHVAGDIGLLIVESDDFPIATPAGGWAHVSGSPQSGGSPGDDGATSLTVFWKRAAGAAEAAPTVTFRSDHIKAFIATVKGAKPSGDPFDVGAGSNTVPGSSGITFPGVTTLQPNSLILHIASLNVGSAFIDFDDWANANLKNISERYDLAQIPTPSGTGTVLLRADKGTPESTGNTTGAYNTGAGVHAKITLSFPPSEKGMDAETGQFTVSGQDAVLAFGRVLVAETGQFAINGQAVTMDKVRAVNLIAETGQFSVAGQPTVMEKEFGRWIRAAAEADTVWTHETPEE